jgi:hypothetical protein
VPWCEQCSKFFNPNSMAPDGTCVKCGSFIADPAAAGTDTKTDEKVPWHFWVLVVAVVVYLGWRLLQGLGWIVQQV